MAVAIKIPFSQEVPNAEHALAYRPGAMAAAGAEARVWGAVGEIGGKTATAFDEWDRRRDEMELVDAKVAFSKAANDDQITWQQRTDLDQRDEKGLSGFRRAGTEFGAARESHAKEIGATLNRRVRDRFMAYAKPAGAEWTERLNLAMIDREYKFNFDKLKDDTSNAIATGDADLPDELAKTAHEWLRPEDWQTYADFQNEERVSDFIRRGMPELALANLDADPTIFGDKKRWDALHLDAERGQRIMALDAKEKLTALKEKTKTELMLGILHGDYLTEAGGFDSRALENAAKAGLIDAAELEHYYTIATKPPPIQTDDDAFLAVSTAIADAKAGRLQIGKKGETPFEQALGIFRENAPWISAEHRQKFMDAIADIGSETNQMEPFYEQQFNQLFRVEAQDETIGFDEATVRHQKRQFASWDFFRKNPGATPAQIREFHDQFFKSAEQTVRQQFYQKLGLLRWVPWVRWIAAPAAARIGERASQQEQQQATQPSAKIPEAAPPGFEDLWTGPLALSDEKKAKVLYLVSKKVPPDIIRESLR